MSGQSNGEMRFVYLPRLPDMPGPVVVEKKCPLEETVSAFAKESEQKIAAELVTTWLKKQTYLSQEGGVITLVSGQVATGLDLKYLESDYWAKYFKEHEEYTEEFWSKPTNGHVEISKHIPDDPVHRMVLHFLRNWRGRLGSYMVDDEIPLEERKLVFNKQIENFAFFSRGNVFGGLWKMYSEPNAFLQLALDNIGVPVTALDENGEPLTTISGKNIIVEACEGVSKRETTCPLPDQMDIPIYDHVRGYAISKLGEDKVHKAWTMVRASFEYTTKQLSYRQRRFYAFSGQPGKELNKIPLEWWEKESGHEIWDEDDDIQFMDGSTLQLGNSLVLTLFNALKPSIEEDLKKITLLAAYEKYTEVESIILSNRRDMTVIDYKNFFDLVMNVVVNYLNRINRALKKILNGKLPGIDTEPFGYYLVVCAKNQQFMPNKQEIEKLLSASCSNTKEVGELCHSLSKMSQTHLSELKEKLDQLPRTFLQLIEKHLKTFKCGEDNVIDMVLCKLMQLHLDAGIEIIVEFVAMDADHQDGKRFCAACAEKVRFYSLLPNLLRTIGFSEDDFHKLAPLLTD